MSENDSTIQKHNNNFPSRNVKGPHKSSKTPGVFHMKIIDKKQQAILIAMIDGISLYLLNRPSDPYTIRVNSMCIAILIQHEIIVKDNTTERHKEI